MHYIYIQGLQKICTVLFTNNIFVKWLAWIVFLITSDYCIASLWWACLFMGWLCSTLKMKCWICCGCVPAILTHIASENLSKIRGAIQCNGLSLDGGPVEGSACRSLGGVPLCLECAVLSLSRLLGHCEPVQTQLPFNVTGSFRRMCVCLCAVHWDVLVWQKTALATATTNYTCS